jgi:hypothetical protein
LVTPKARAKHEPFVQQTGLCLTQNNLDSLQSILRILWNQPNRLFVGSNPKNTNWIFVKDLSSFGREPNQNKNGEKS